MGATSWCMAPVFAAGNVLISDVFDNLMAQSFYNPHLMTIIQLLIFGGSADPEKMADLQVDANLKDSAMFPLSCTLKMASLSYGECFSILASNGIVPICVRRGVQSKSKATTNSKSNHAYIVTNPSKDFRLREVDTLFCFASENPLAFRNIPELGIVAAKFHMAKNSLTNMKYSSKRLDLDTVFNEALTNHKRRTSSASQNEDEANERHESSRDKTHTLFRKSSASQDDCSSDSAFHTSSNCTCSNNSTATERAVCEARQSIESQLSLMETMMARFSEHVAQLESN